ncbi:MULTISPECIES: response regulator transcription factor [Metabacillus]|uniref:DNA-binding response regulator n=2 Tax=Metabacillus TaxID=2675233 RepID=A0A179T2U5_9BACI|nr:MULTISPECIES: response regulator transcription factor [Metabacillus]OAS87630.1 DNA-binding response regulator [Metabacillus litoralis]QNF26972.1 response regulator transcription factor [Metabacillus sp. KUDC1714]
MNVLLAEDDVKLGELITYMLEKKANYQVEWVQTGEDAYDYASASHYDVIIMDWMMPNGDGVEICKRLRNDSYGGAILMLTAKDALQDRVVGLDAGADDYLVKPFEIDELLARLRALARRNFSPIREEILTIEGLSINRTSQSLQMEQQVIQLTPREYQLLDLLVQNKGQVLTRDIIFDRIWGNETDVSYKTIDATVKLLRKKLTKFQKGDWLQSIRGVGYKLDT